MPIVLRSSSRERGIVVSRRTDRVSPRDVVEQFFRGRFRFGMSSAVVRPPSKLPARAPLVISYQISFRFANHAERFQKP